MKYVLFHFQLSIQIKLKDLLKCTILEMIKTIYAECSLVLSTSSSIVIGLATIFSSPLVDPRLLLNQMLNINVLEKINMAGVTFTPKRLPWFLACIHIKPIMQLPL